METATCDRPSASTESTTSAEKYGGRSARNGAMSIAAPRDGAAPIAAKGRRTSAARRRKNHERRHCTLPGRYHSPAARASGGAETEYQSAAPSRYSSQAGGRAIPSVPGDSEISLRLRSCRLILAFTAVAASLPFAFPAGATMPTPAGTLPREIAEAIDRGISLPARGTGLGVSAAPPAVWRIPVILAAFADEDLTYTAADFDSATCTCSSPWCVTAAWLGLR